MPAAASDVVSAYAATWTPVIVGVVVGIIFVASTLFVANLLAPRMRSRGKAATMRRYVLRMPAR